MTHTLTQIDINAICYIYGIYVENLLYQITQFEVFLQKLAQTLIEKGTQIKFKINRLTQVKSADFFRGYVRTFEATLKDNCTNYLSNKTYVIILSAHILSSCFYFYPQT